MQIIYMSKSMEKHTIVQIKQNVRIIHLWKMWSFYVEN